MKIAVVGAYGFIGSNLWRGLETLDFTVRAIGRYDAMDFAGCDIVYNVAGVTGGSGLASRDPLAMVGTNIRVALDVFDAAKRDGVKRVIAMSSTTGYPDVPWAVTESEYFDGHVHPAYTNPGETRRYLERLGRMYPFDTTFVRCSGVYGPSDDYDPVTSHVIGATIRKVAERQDPIVCWGNGEDTRDAVYVDDLVRALIAMTRLSGSQALNIGTGRMMSVNAMIRTLADHAGYNPAIEHDTSKPQMIKARLLNVNKAKSLLGWEAKVPMEEGLRMALDNYADTNAHL